MSAGEGGEDGEGEDQEASLQIEVIRHGNVLKLVIL